MNPNEPAYPVESGHAYDANGVLVAVSKTGLSKRELLTAMAMQGLCANPAVFNGNCNDSDVSLVDMASQLADAQITNINATDVCAWEYCYTRLGKTTCGNVPIDFYDARKPFCPYCGKRIQVKEGQ